MNTLPTLGFLELQLKLKGINQRRDLGQHFLFDDVLLGRIADWAAVDAGTLALEIGPGAGALTTKLAERGASVLAVEFDQRLRPLHQDAFGTHPQIRFHYADALRVDLQATAREMAAELGLESMVLTGNLPFQITSPLLFGQCGPGVPWRRMTVMVQREVADRICAPTACKAYGILSVKLAYWWRVTERLDVPASAFRPAPKVDASVLVLEPLAPEAAPPAALWPGLSTFIDAAFGQRRKMIGNSLAGRWSAFPGKESFRDTLDRQGIPERTRAEELSPTVLRQLYERLIAKKSNG